MTIEEWYVAYLLRFGTTTIYSVELQDGEREFLTELSKSLAPDIGSANIDFAWEKIKKQHQIYKGKAP